MDRQLWLSVWVLKFSKNLTESYIYLIKLLLMSKNIYTFFVQQIFTFMYPYGMSRLKELSEKVCVEFALQYFFRILIVFYITYRAYRINISSWVRSYFYILILFRNKIHLLCSYYILNVPIINILSELHTLNYILLLTGCY